MDELADQFEARRSHLRDVACRMLGSASEAEDAVQETWLRLTRSDVSGVANLGGWLTTVIARVCLDMLRARKTRRSSPIDDRARGDADPTRDTMIADSLGAALLVVLETLSPAERVAFVLHDMFDLSFDEIAPIVGRSEAATRQLASRARRRVQGADKMPDAELSENRRIIEAFLAAARAGDFDGLIAVLDPDVVVDGDAAALRLGGGLRRGADMVARAFVGRAQAARAALVEGAVGIVVAPHGKLRIVIDVTVRNGRIAAMDAVAEPENVKHIEFTVFD